MTGERQMLEYEIDVHTARRIIDQIKGYLDNLGTLQLAGIPLLAGFLVIVSLLLFNPPYTEPISGFAISLSFFLFGCTGFAFIVRKEAFIVRGWPAVLFGWFMVILCWYQVIQLSGYGYIR